MKKIFLTLIGLVVILVGCGNEEESTEESANSDEESAEATMETSDDANEANSENTQVPEDIENLVEQPIENDEFLNDDGSYSNIKGEMINIWSYNDLLPAESEAKIVNDMKEELRLSSYEDYMALKEIGLEDVEENKNLNLGTPGFTPKNDYIYKNNQIVNLGDINIVGVNFGPFLNSLRFEVENNSDENLDMNKIVPNLQFRFVEDIGVGTEWFGATEELMEYTDYITTIDEQNNKDQGTLHRYLGRGLTKTVDIHIATPELIQEGIYLDEALDVNGVLDFDSGEFLDIEIGKTVDNIPENKENYGAVYENVSDFQNNLPETINIQIKYDDSTTDYTILKSTEEVLYDYATTLQK